MLMDIYPNTINIPKIGYNAHVTLPSTEFSRIVSDHSQLGDRIQVEVRKEGVRFISHGRAVSGNIFFRQADGSHIAGSITKPKTGDEGGELGEGNR